MILDTLLDYYQFAEKSEALPADKIESAYQKVLAERFVLPVGEKLIVPPEVQPPHEGRAASQIRLGFAHNDKFGDGLAILLRPTYYDVLDTDAGQVSDSALAMGEIKLFVKNELLKIRHIDLFKIKSVNHGITGLSGDNGKAWKLKLGVQQQNLSCYDCLALKFEGDYGFTARPYSAFLIGTFIGGGLQDNRRGSGNLFIKASVFAHLRLSGTLNMRMLAEIPEQIDGSGGGESFFSLELRRQLGVNADLRFLHEKKLSSEYSFVLGYYF